MDPKDNQAFEKMISTLIFHPELLKLLSKILKHLYSKEPRPFNLYDEKTGNDVVPFLSRILGKRSRSATLTVFLSKLKNNEILKIMNMIYLDPGFKIMQRDGWNYYGEYINQWPGVLESLLSFNGIKWDESKRNFVLNGAAIDATSPLGIKLISRSFSDPFFGRLSDEIYRAYNSNMVTATFILTRKLLENLVIELLRSKFNNDVSKYYDTSKHRFLGFSNLVDNLKKEKDQFAPDESNVTKLVELLNEFKDKANAQAHSIIEIDDMQSLDKFKVEHTVNLLVRLLERNGKAQI